MPGGQDSSDTIARMDRRGLDPTGLAGRWVNTNAHGNGIQELTIDVDSGVVELYALSKGRRGSCSWGPIRADLLCGSNSTAHTAMSFTGRHDFGMNRIELQGNVNLGLLVVASFNRVGSGCHDYFAREFYRRDDRAAAPPATPWDVSAGRVGGDDPDEAACTEPGLPFDGSEIFGDWWNTNPDSSGIVRLRIDDNMRNGAVVRLWQSRAPRAAEPDSVDADLFALSSGSRLAKAFSARYQAHEVDVRLQANIKQGVLVVASFTQFDADDGRANYFQREFYYRS